MGIIIYYILWPLVAITIIIHWFFSMISNFIEFCVEIVKDIHEDIKKF